MHTRDGHPEVGSPNTSFRIIVTTMSTNARKQNKTHMIEAIASGSVVNATIPSSA